MDALHDWIFYQLTRISQCSRKILLFWRKLLFSVPLAEKWGILGIQDRLSISRLDGETETFYQDCFLQPGVQASDGDIFLQTNELYWFGGLLWWRMILMHQYLTFFQLFRANYQGLGSSFLFGFRPYFSSSSIMSFWRLPIYSSKALRVDWSIDTVSLSDCLVY